MKTLPLLALVGALASACLGSVPETRAPTLVELRDDGKDTSDPEIAGHLLLLELLAPGGDAARARAARKRLDGLGAGGMLAGLARGLDDELHGRPADASEHYLGAVRAARDAQDERSRWIAWFAANRAVQHADDSPGLWKRWSGFVGNALRDPRHLGWRARGELVEWAIDSAFREGKTDVDRIAVEAYGCLTEARLAGPFGRGSPGDAVTRFAAERPGAWPYRWPKDPTLSPLPDGADADPTPRRAPHLLETQTSSCAIESDERLGGGTYYVETFFDLDRPRDIVVAVQGALSVLVDDTRVLDRDVRRFGVWPEFGVALRLGAGRHRLVARLGEPSTSVRMLQPDGTPLGIKGSTDAGRAYGGAPPVVLASPNALATWVYGGTVHDPKDDLARYVGAYLAQVESSSDVASILMEPLLKDLARATGPTLDLAAVIASSDPIFEASQAKDLVRELQARATKKDPGLWASRLSLALGLSERKGAEEAVPDLERLYRETPGVADVGLSLARLYAELGWTAEHARLIMGLEAKFPNDIAVLHAALNIFDDRGDWKAVDRIKNRIRALDPDSEVDLTRALARQDFAAAIAELERLAKLHPGKDELAERVHDARVRAGNVADVEKKLRAAVANDPTNPAPRLELADALFAAGDRGSLYQGVADAIQAGANSAQLEDAIDLVEGMTELEPYRLDARKIVDDYEKSGRTMEGTAARILDYAAVWVHADGSSRMLEHEIVRLQSAEAIASFAEHRVLEGLVLHMRVIKRDGTTLEPESVPGKPTVTFPHLEVGDYIETEQVLFSPGDGHGGEYTGPRWFFREENVAYARSEFVVLSPASRPLVIETSGAVPKPTVTNQDGIVVRRWRADESPAAPVEPGSVPITEFLPSVRIGWGITLEKRLRRLGDAMEPLVPIDPRVRRIAVQIAGKVPSKKPIDRARKLYRWLLDNVEAGDETDARRVIIGKHGNLWHGFRLLCRALDIPVRYGVAENRLAPPPGGPLSAAGQFAHPVAQVGTGKDAVWLTLGNKYAPFGYVPAEVRGMKLRYLDGNLREEAVVSDAGSVDAITFTGKGKLDARGSLTIDLVEEFSGKLAIALRKGLSQVADERLHDVLESNLLAQTLRGGELVKHSIEHRDDFDAPLVIRMTVKVPRFAQTAERALVVAPPLTPDLGRLATLPSRVTPLLLGEALDRRIRLDIELPKGATAAVSARATFSNGDRSVVLSDQVKKGVLHLERSIAIPAGRVQPADYARFAQFAQQTDDALSRVITVKLK